MSRHEPDAAAHFAAFRSLLNDRVRDVTQITEREVMRAADGVAKIVEVAQSAMDGAMELARHAGVGGADQQQSAIARQSALISEHQRVLRDHLRRQEQLTKHTLEQAGSIRVSSTTIARLTIETRVLALNARIEAGRAAEGSRGFAVVATEMQRLSTEIAAANEKIQELAANLGAMMPELAQSSGELRGYVETFSTDIEESIARVRDESAALDGAAHRVARSSEGSLREVIGASHDVLSHLQFQDIVAQALHKIETRFCELQRDVANSLDLSGLASDLPDESAIAPVDDGSVESTIAGEVTLF